MRCGLGKWGEEEVGRRSGQQDTVPLKASSLIKLPENKLGIILVYLCNVVLALCFTKEQIQLFPTVNSWEEKYKNNIFL